MQSQPVIELEAVIDVITQITLREGQMEPTFVVDCGDRTLFVQVYPLADTHSARAKQAFFVGHDVAVRENTGTLRRAFFVSEGWQSTCLHGGPPSQDPHRVEVLIFTGMDITTQDSFYACFHMKRDAADRLVDLERVIRPDMTVRSYLLEAFVKGFQSHTLA